MTVNNKLAEAEYFFEQIKQLYPDIKYLKYYYSAFLYSTDSIFDFLLSEAAKKFNLNLPIDKKWYPSHFETVAKGNAKAERFFKHWDETKKEFENTSVGKVFKETRDLNTHKISQKPEYAATIEIDKPLPNEKPVLVQIHDAKNTEVEYEDFMDLLELSKKGHLGIWNRNRDENSQLTLSNLKTKIWMSPPGLERHELIEVCQVVLTFMKRYVELTRKNYF